MSNRRATKSVPKAPYVSREFVEWLELQYPEILHDIGTSTEAIHRHYGKRELINRLRRLLDESDK